MRAAAKLLCLAFKPIEEVQKAWQPGDCVEKIKLLLEDIHRQRRQAGAKRSCGLAEIHLIEIGRHVADHLQLLTLTRSAAIVRDYLENSRFVGR